MMTELEAKALVANTLGAAFDRKAFAKLLGNMLKKVDPEKVGQWTGPYVKSPYQDHVCKYDRIGQYTDPNGDVIDLLVVRLQKAGAMIRARSALRGFVAHHLKMRDNKAAALVAFHFPDETAWRFSFVRMRHDLVEASDGFGVRRTFTPARRYSFLVGKEEKTHTAQRQLAGLLQSENPPTIKELEYAFSVEPVTKRFFEEYHGLYGRVRDAVKAALAENKKAKADFAEKGINPADFAKKLLGQIVFLYFLQRKGWLGVPPGKKWGSGDSEFLRSQFNCKQGANFYAEILQRIFYDALRLKRPPDDIYDSLNCRIPFLNGGLFTPLKNHDWVDCGLQLPDKLFSNQTETPEGDIGNGILDVFARYNFTVAEDEPAEREVAVDPEMLGKVFENLIEEGARKAQGAFYTPREIVHFMCRESLRQHLTAETARRKIPTAEPELNEFIETADLVRETEELLVGNPAGDKTNKIPLPPKVREHAADLDTILREIRVCDPAVGSGAFVVGMMHEIVRLRAALAPAHGQKEANEYQMKRDTIQNSLYGVDIDAGAVDIAQLRLWLSLVVDENDLDKIQPLPNLDYKIIPGDTLASIRDVFTNPKFWELEELQDAFFDETRPSEKKKIQAKINRIVHELTGGKPLLDPSVHFSRVNREHGGFDIVIGNPPYDELDNTKKNPVQKKYVAHLRGTYTHSIRGKINLYRVFIERGFQLVRKEGALSLIVPSTLLADRAAVGVRQMMALNGAMRFLIELPESTQVFESVTQATAIFLTNKSKSQKYFDLSIGLRTPNLPPSDSVQMKWDSIREISGEELTVPLVINKAECSLIKKMHTKTTLLSQIAHIGKGDARLGSNGDMEISNSPQSHILVRGEHVQRYTVDLSNKNTDRRWVDFPTLLKNSNSRRALAVAHRVAKERVVCQNVANMGLRRRIIASLISKGTVTADSTNFIYPQIGMKWDARSMLAVLSSRLLNWRFKKTSSNNHVNVYELERMPFPLKVPVKKMERLSELAEDILQARRAGLDLESVKGAESEIDSLVYGLFGLTDREIALVERE